MGRQVKRAEFDAASGNQPLIIPSFLTKAATASPVAYDIPALFDTVPTSVKK